MKDPRDQDQRSDSGDDPRCRAAVVAGMTGIDSRLMACALAAILELTFLGWSIVIGNRYSLI